MPSGKKPAGKTARKKGSPARGGKGAGTAHPRLSRPKARQAAAAKAARGTSATAPAVEPGAPSAEGVVVVTRSSDAVRRAQRAERPVGKTITIQQIRSGIQAPLRHKRTLKSLGLRHPHHRVVRPDNPAVRGMVNSIPHLAQIVEG